MDIEELPPVDFPDAPESLLSNDDARQAVVKASAYITLALEEANIDHKRDSHAAMVTDATYTLEEDCTPNEYLQLAIQELAFAEGEVESSLYEYDLRELRQTLQSIVN